MKHDSEAISNFLKPREGEKDFHSDTQPQRDEVQIRNYGIVRENKSASESMPDVMVVDAPQAALHCCFH